MTIASRPPGGSAVLLFAFATLVACAADKKPAEAPGPREVDGKKETEAAPAHPPDGPPDGKASGVTESGGADVTSGTTATPTAGVPEPETPQAWKKPPPTTSPEPTPTPNKPGTKAPTTASPPPPEKSIAVRIAEADVTFKKAEQSFQAAGNDCASLCKALASMKRATEHLCELTQKGAGSEQKRCTDAKAKLETAQTKVKATCGTACSG